MGGDREQAKRFSAPITCPRGAITDGNLEIVGGCPRPPDSGFRCYDVVNVRVNVNFRPKPKLGPCEHAMGT